MRQICVCGIAIAAALGFAPPANARMGNVPTIRPPLAKVTPQTLKVDTKVGRYEGHLTEGERREGRHEDHHTDAEGQRSEGRHEGHHTPQTPSGFNLAKHTAVSPQPTVTPPPTGHPRGSTPGSTQPTPQTLQYNLIERKAVTP
jgi:hypothetical protein